jgi:hypothetical protein
MASGWTDAAVEFYEEWSEVEGVAEPDGVPASSRAARLGSERRNPSISFTCRIWSVAACEDAGTPSHGEIRHRLLSKRVYFDGSGL